MNSKAANIEALEKEIKKEHAGFKLNPMHKVFLSLNCSLTAFLESIFGEIRIKTLEQRITRADKKLAEALEIKENAELNYRIVVLFSVRSKRNLVHAISLTPIERIEPEFRDEIMKRDLPIGKIMEKLDIEARREINEIFYEKAGNLAEIFSINKGDVLLGRKYSIIRNKKIMMKIEEKMPWRFLAELRF